MPILPERRHGGNKVNGSKNVERSNAVLEHGGKREMKFNFRTGDTPARLIADTFGLLIIVGLCWLGWMVTP